MSVVSLSEPERQDGQVESVSTVSTTFSEPERQDGQVESVSTVSITFSEPARQDGQCQLSVPLLVKLTLSRTSTDGKVVSCQYHF